MMTNEERCVGIFYVLFLHIMRRTHLQKHKNLYESMPASLCPFFDHQWLFRRMKDYCCQIYMILCCRGYEVSNEVRLNVQ